MFCVKTASRTYEMSASDTKQRQEWTLGEYYGVSVLLLLGQDCLFLLWMFLEIKLKYKRDLYPINCDSLH